MPPGFFRSRETLIIVIKNTAFLSVGKKPAVTLNFPCQAFRHKNAHSRQNVLIHPAPERMHRNQVFSIAHRGTCHFQRLPFPVSGRRTEVLVRSADNGNFTGCKFNFDLPFTESQMSGKRVIRPDVRSQNIFRPVRQTPPHPCQFPAVERGIRLRQLRHFPGQRVQQDRELRGVFPVRDHITEALPVQTVAEVEKRLSLRTSRENLRRRIRHADRGDILSLCRNP